jgi:6,7-dimethyl-8-ribityllumazine synthase
MAKQRHQRLIDEAPIPGARVLVVEARYYEDISDELLAGALARLESARVGVERLEVPGALEIPPAAAIALDAATRAGKPFDGLVALGCVIRGETTHYEVVARESAAGLHQLAVEHAVPIGNGIITCDTREQAWARASVDGRNKGRDAARAYLALMQLEQHFSSASRR